jgi:hypothetical protein
MICRRGKVDTYQCVDVGHPHEHTAFFRVLPHHLATEVSANKIDDNVLTARVEGPDNFAPRDGTLVCFAEYVLSEEQQKAPRIVIY